MAYEPKAQYDPVAQEWFRAVGPNQWVVWKEETPGVPTNKRLVRTTKAHPSLTESIQASSRI